MVKQVSLIHGFLDWCDFTGINYKRFMVKQVSLIHGFLYWCDFTGIILRDLWIFMDIVKHNVDTLINFN